MRSNVTLMCGCYKRCDQLDWCSEAVLSAVHAVCGGGCLGRALHRASAWEGVCVTDSGCLYADIASLCSNSVTAPPIHPHGDSIYCNVSLTSM